MRTETDALGSLDIPEGAYHGIHTQRAVENFPLSGQRWRSPFIAALAQVKLACALTNADLGLLDPAKGRAVAQACEELAAGQWHEQILVDPFQGGAGTSTNMNLNEVIANRAIELLGGRKGDYALVHPLHDVNRHQSTNDVFPTGLKVACLHLLKDLETRVATLQGTLQCKELEFADVVKVGRTQLRDAVPMTLGMEFGAFAEAVARDRWRVFKSRERLKQVNLGGTAVGTGLGAPREYIFRVVEHLKRITGLPVSRAENLVDATQNMDCLVEAVGMLNALAANLLKISNDLRLLASGPDCGLGEIELPAVQAGSSIMAGKINPVIPEAVAQVALRVMAANHAVTLVASLGQLDLNQFMPLLAHECVEALVLLANVVAVFEERCVRGIAARSDRCRAHVTAGKALATVLVPVLGYERVEEIVHQAEQSGKSVADVVTELGIADAALVAELLSPRRMRKLGFTDADYIGLKRE